MFAALPISRNAPGNHVLGWGRLATAGRWQGDRSHRTFLLLSRRRCAGILLNPLREVHLGNGRETESHFPGSEPHRHGYGSCTGPGDGWHLEERAAALIRTIEQSCLSAVSRRLNHRGPLAGVRLRWGGESLLKAISTQTRARRAIW